MLKYMCKKNPKLMTSFFILVGVILVWGFLLVQDAIQKEMAAHRSTESVEIVGDTGEIKSYNVDGMTDEQIEQLLEIERNRKEE